MSNDSELTQVRLPSALLEGFEIDGIAVPVIGRLHLIANKRAVARPQDLVDAELLESST